MDFKIFKHKKFSEIKVSCAMDEFQDNELAFHQLYVCKSEDEKGYDVGQLLRIDGLPFGNKLAWFPHLKDAIGECESINRNFIHPLKGWSNGTVYNFQISHGFDEFRPIIGRGPDYKSALVDFCNKVTSTYVTSQLFKPNKSVNDKEDS